LKNSKKRFDFDKRLRSGAPLKILGLNSGTSADGLNFVLAEFRRGALPDVLKARVIPFKRTLRERIIACAELEFADGIQWLSLDSELGHLMGTLTRRYLASLKVTGLKVDLLASHGQTIRHIPEKSLTFQAGNPAIIASMTGLPVVADFRRSDIAAGGQGAPLSPLLHEHLFCHKKKWRAIVNIGGISNITILPPRGSRYRPVAADCGPGNMAIDRAMSMFYGKAYDRDGKIALSGRPSERIVSRIMRLRFFKLPPPKSTGRELYGSGFVDSVLRMSAGFSTEDIISTISEITVRGIADFLRKFAGSVNEILLCGGGTKNAYIISRLCEDFPRCFVESTSVLGYDPEHIEALLWAYLGYLFVTGTPVNARSYTGASRSYIPGSLWLP